MVVLQEIEQEVNSRVYDIWYVVVSYLSVSRCFSLDTDMWCCSYLSAFYVLLCDWWFFWYILITCLLPQLGLLDTLTQIQIKLMQNNLMRLKQWTYYFYFPSHLSPLSLSPSEHSLPPSLSPPLSFSFPVIRIETSRQLFSTSTELHSFLKRDASLSVSACID